ncbi:hypothetical protein C1645_880276 [Glomus cerebriforme]|uniref:SWIM-type domain-containing protein n=1 Tax=Glomus cerebriforme TaxID=658196 RepID=A0A397SIM1_9GLOM|nr:hypothetical protein C1645_880276 [Glomus cerebriforme]
MTSKSSSTRKNHQVYTYVSCLAFAKIKKNHDNNYIELDSYLEHLDICVNLKPQQLPPLCINKTVKIIAINMLRAQVHPAAILEDNMKFIELNLGGNVLIDNERFLLTSQDIINFRNSMTKDIWGIDIRSSVEKNIHQLFEINDDETIKASTIYYKPKQSNQDRLMLVLATPEQRKIAWKHGHNGIIHFNGTFGFSNKKVLLFVLLVVNQDNKGIPIGYLLFSAASGAQKASNSYNHSILKELLKWLDTDHKERLALLEVWPHIHLLLCEFHIILYWKNKMKHMLGSHGGYDVVSYRKDMKEYLNNNIKRIKSAQNHEAIVNILSNMEQHLLSILQQNHLNSKILSIVNGGLEFIKYFKEHWIGNIELGWTYFGRLIAANILNIPVNSIPNTNNHLEAFNNQLKSHQLDRFKNGGHLLRLDILSILLIKSITPNLLLQYTNNSLLLWIKSSGSNQIEQQTYIVSLLPSTYCQCLDFLSRGGACKHIRAAIIWINWLRSQPSENIYYPNLQHNQLPLITLPSQEAAFKDQAQELLLFEQELQEAYTNDNTLEVLNSISSNSNSAITNNNTNDKDKDETTTQDETITPTEATTPRAPLSPLNLSTKHSISIWKQEYITSISNLLADLNDLITIEKSMNRLTHNRPAEVDSNTENIAKEVTTLLNKLNNCEELVKLKDITGKKKMEQETKGK